jgi:hypothetical protein
VPDASSKQAPQPETQIEKARRLENEAAEIEREYDVNPSWSSQIFGWLAKHWKSNDANAEQNQQKFGNAEQNPQKLSNDEQTKTGMGSYV